MCVYIYVSFPGGSDGKASACSARDLGSIPGLGRSHGEGNSNPIQYSCLEKSQRSLVGYSPWGCKESDMTERLLFFYVCVCVCVIYIYVCIWVCVVMCVCNCKITIWVLILTINLLNKILRWLWYYFCLWNITHQGYSVKVLCFKVTWNNIIPLPGIMPPTWYTGHFFQFRIYF